LLRERTHQQDFKKYLNVGGIRNGPKCFRRNVASG
jgi:hypothetical protein